MLALARLAHRFSEHPFFYSLALIILCVWIPLLAYLAIA
jgi:hypothetical protein